MVTAIVMLQVERDSVNEVAGVLAEMESVSEVYSIAGHFDLAAIIRAPDNDRLADVVTNKMLKVPGIVRSETNVAFRVYSRHDLESMFSL